MSPKPALKALVSTLRGHTTEGTLNAAAVQAATADLSRLGYAYDASLFPPLPTNHRWGIPALVEPQSLAEALLWKMGKWKIYKSFVAHYGNASSTPKNTDVVFHAFAKHLRDPSRPIYDQHALRALWAIDAGLTPEQASACRNLLVKRSGKWKPIASGSKTPVGYQIYAVRVAALCSDDVLLGDLDKLLMPLGQALKDNTATLSEFTQFAGHAP